MDAIKVAIVVVSDTASQDATTDKAIPILKEVFETSNTSKSTNVRWNVCRTDIVRDDVKQIQETVQSCTDEQGIDLVLTTGGTGFAVKDYTPEAIREMITKEAPGIVHAMLAASLAITPFAMMSRPVAGVRKSSLIITLPGSPKGAKENLEAIIKFLPHACIQVKGGDSRKIHVGGVEKLEKEVGLQNTPETMSQKLSESQQRSAHADHFHSCESHSHNHTHGHGAGHHAPRSHTQQHVLSKKIGSDVTGRDRVSPYKMLSVSEAQKLIDENTVIGDIIEVPVDSALVGYILAEDVMAAESVPAFRASIVDGYAIIHSDGAGVFPVASVSHAQPGDIPPLQSGTIARITTGAPLPDGATAVIMVEDTALRKKTEDGMEELEVELLASDLSEGENIREIGSDIKTGTIVLKKGDRITAVGGEIGVLASIGKASVKVFARPVVGVLSTGDEVVDHDRPEKLCKGEIRDSNRPVLLAVVKACGYECVDLGIATDKAASLEGTLKAAISKVDVVITTGGVSMGEKDLMKPTIEHTLNGTIHFGRVTMKPGKPTTFATVTKPSSDKKCLIFSLPGNPASATVTFHLFVLPALRKASGYASPYHHLPRALVRVHEDLPLDPRRPEYHRAHVSIDKTGELVATSTGGQRSSRIGSLATANALLCLPSQEDVGDKRTRIPGGDKVEAILLGALN